MTLGAVQASEVIVTAILKFSFNLSKTFTEWFQLLNQVYGHNCLSRGRIPKWFRCLKTVQLLAQPKFMIIDDSTVTVRSFIKHQSKVEMEIGLNHQFIACLPNIWAYERCVHSFFQTS